MIRDLYQRIKNTSQQISNAIVQTYTQTKSAVKIIYSFASKYMLMDFGQFWLGLTRFFDLSIFATFYNSPKTRNVLAQSFKANIGWYMGSALLYEIGAAYTFRLYPGMKDSYTEYAIDTMVKLYFMRWSCHLLLDNTAYSLALTKATTEENPNTKIFKPCTCGIPLLPQSMVPAFSVIKANIEAPVYYVTNYLLMDFYGSKLPLTRVASLPLMSYFYGMVFLDYNLTTMCMKHRSQLLAKNNAYAMGMGLIYNLLLLVPRLLLEYKFGITNRVFNEALSNFLFQYFVMLALLIDRPLPGKEIGVDLFTESRLLGESLIKRILAFIDSIMLDSKEQTVTLDAILNFPPLVFIKNVVLNKNYRSLDDLAKTPAMQTLLDVRGDELQDILHWLIYLRKLPMHKRVKSFLGVVPDYLVSTKITNVIRTFLDKKLDGVIEDINNFISRARIKITVHDPEALKKLLDEVASPEPAETNVPAIEDQQPASVTPLQSDWELVEDDFFKPTQEKTLQDEINESFGITDNANDSNLQRHSLFSQLQENRQNTAQTRARRRFAFPF